MSVNSKKAESQKKVSPTPATRNTMTVNVSHAEKQNPRGSCNQLQSKHIEGRPDTLDGGLTGSCGSKHTQRARRRDYICLQRNTREERTDPQFCTHHHHANLLFFPDPDTQNLLQNLGAPLHSAYLTEMDRPVLRTFARSKKYLQGKHLWPRYLGQRYL